MHANHERIHHVKISRALDELGEGIIHPSQLGALTCIEEKPHGWDERDKRFIQDVSSKNNERDNKVKKPYACDKCDKCFTISSALDTHMRIHTGEKPFACNECGACFRVPESLKCHKRIHTGERPYACDDCGKSFRVTKGLRLHKRIHTGERPYACDECGKRFRTPSCLGVHKRTHTGEKPYSCDKCGRRFSTTGIMQRHKVTHTAEKPFACDKCDRSFRGFYQLRIHERTHTGERPYICDVCGKGFRESYKVKAHKRTHSVEKSYLCDECGEFLTDSNGLRIHKRTSHKGKKPDACHRDDRNSMKMGAPGMQEHTHTSYRSSGDFPVAQAPGELYSLAEGLYARIDPITLSQNRDSHFTGAVVPSSDIDMPDGCGEFSTDPESLIIHKQIHTDENVRARSEDDRNSTHPGALEIYEHFFADLYAPERLPSVSDFDEFYPAPSTSFAQNQESHLMKATLPLIDFDVSRYLQDI